MSYHAPVLVVTDDESSPTLAALTDAGLSAVLASSWPEAGDAIGRLRPSAVVVDSGMPVAALETLARRIAPLQPYVPLIAIGTDGGLPENVMPFSADQRDLIHLAPRLRAALRVRTLHATAMRRLSDPGDLADQSGNDPLQDATVLLIGRGAVYPSLSVALGERVGVVGALSIEAAAKHLNVRDLDGIVLAEGFSPRVVDAFLTVLSEDTRFRNLPIVVGIPAPHGSFELPNLEFVDGDAARIVGAALPLVRQRAFEAQLARTLASLDAGGLLDPRTGLLTEAAFERDFATAVYQAQTRGEGLSVARFVLHRADRRAVNDAARIISRLMRKMDFGTLQTDGSLLVVFAATDLRNAQAIARRLSSVIRQTAHSARREARIDPDVSVATLLPDESARAILTRVVQQDRRRAAS
ncbi:GGDEF domain-containing protein [Rhodopseudomonas palustris]|uniref:GGDEF domain-containing protein n=1 Tax=Rhodopseudomonas palustris TaxID=1076 RepID=A0A323UNC5_RHOPL|nr:GGDEF domain-containing protein [Rhodopseudomonas palustris]PZA13797.1 GGDEF domain-containing protein [Rhodopseudomonas palustris]